MYAHIDSHTDLATQRMEGGSNLGACLHTGPLSTHPHGKVLSTDKYDVDKLKKAQKEGRLRSNMASERVGYPEKDTRYVLDV